MWPPPMSNGSAAVAESSLATSGEPVVISADLIIAGVQSGCACVSKAPTPATCGLDIDVPWMAWNNSPGAPRNGVGLLPARICTPGAVTSGLMMSGAARFGPRDENTAMSGAPASGAAEPAVNDAVAPAPALSTYSATAKPSAGNSVDVGSRWLSVGVTLTCGGSYRIMPTPPEARMPAPCAILAMPVTRRHSTIAPA